MTEWNSRRLKQSILRRDMSEFKKALTEIVEINSIHSSGGSFLLMCCKISTKNKCKDNVDEWELSPSEEMAKALIRKGADLNAKDKCGRTILHYCIINNKTFFTNLLIEEGANVCLPSNGIKPLDLAISHGNVTLCRLLLNNGAGVTLSTGLLEAIGKGNLEIVTLFIKEGANVNFCSSSGYTSLTKTLLVVENDDTKEKIIKLLIAAGANPFQRDGEERYPLMEAVKKRALKLVKIIVESKPKFDADDQLIINKALHEAVNMHHLGIVKFLAEKDADIYFKDESDLSVLDKAIKNQYFHMVKYLLNEKYFIDEVRQNIQKYSYTALVNYDLRTLGELAKVAPNFGKTFANMEKLSETNDDIRDLYERLQTLVRNISSSDGKCEGAQEAKMDTMETNNS